MKKVFFTLSIIFLAITANVLFSSSIIFNHSWLKNAGSPAARTGSPGDGGATCRITSCHISGPAVTPKIGWITSNVPGSGYVPGNTYTISATITAPGHVKFGFEISPQTPTGALMGSLVNTSTGTHIVSTKYMTHTSTGMAGTGAKTWSFNWVAPASGSGQVTFYGAFNVSNNNNTASGDTIYTSTLVIPEGTSDVDDPDNLNTDINIYPSVVHQSFTLAYCLNEPTEIVASLFDMEGKEVQNFLFEKQFPGNYSIPINCSNLSSGIYIVKIMMNDHSITKKIVVAK